MTKRLLLAACVVLVAAPAAAVPTFPCGPGGFPGITAGECYEIRGPFPLGTEVEFSVRGFDPALGTLESVYIDAWVGFHGMALLYNPTPVPITGGVHVRYLGAYGGVGWGPYVMDNFNVWLTGSQFVPPGESLTLPFAGNAISELGNTGYTPSFITKGGVPMTFYSGSLTPLNTGDLLVDITAAEIDTARFNVVYRYDPVPEPSTSALLGLGAVILLAWRRSLRR